jgi:PKD repeat protein
LVHGGQQPVSGATVQLWQVGTTGYGVGAGALGGSATTDAGGNFSITGDYGCSSSTNGNNSLVYITATGGNPGLAPGTNNTALTMMAALGTCGSLTDSTFININEVTTVGSVYALSQFMSANGQVGSYGSSAQGLTNAFATVNNLVNVGSGVALSVTPNGNGVVPQAEINTLANIIATCVNSSGPTSTGCSSLFTAATPPGGSAPGNTIASLLSIAQNPGNNATAMLLLPPPTSPFQPVLTSVNDWTMSIGYASGGSTPKSLAVDGTGNVWIANYGTGGATSSVSMLSPSGVPAANSPFSGATYINGSAALAVDLNNNVWIANEGNNSAAELNATLTGNSYSIGTVGSPLNGIGLAVPSAVAIDPLNNLWFVNSGNNQVTEVPSNGCSTTTCVTNYSGLNNPAGIALDSSGNAWVTNTGGASVTKIIPGSTPAAFTGGGLNSPVALAIDGSSNVWVTDSSLTEVSQLNSAGTAVSPSAGISGGGVSPSTSVAIDGNGSVWIADATTNGLSQLNSSGTPVTAASGYRSPSVSAPSSLGIDPSGNIWVANGTPLTSGPLQFTVTEFIGLAAPTITPLAQAVMRGQLGQTPGSPVLLKPPVAIISGSYTGAAGTPVTFSGAGSTDPKDEALLYSWNFGDGAGGSGPTPSHSYFSPGPFAVTLTVTNADGKQSTASTNASIGPGSVTPPIAVPGTSYSGTQYSALTFNGLGSSDPTNPAAGGLGVNYTWNFGDGAQGTGPTPVHTYTSAGNFNVTLTVQSVMTAATASATTTAAIAAGTAPAGAPTAAAGGPYTGAAGAAVSFNGSGSTDPNNLPLTYLWSFGDGNESSVANPTHTYANGGSYSVALTVSNGTTQSTAGTGATITAPSLPALIASAGGPYTVAANQPLVLDGTQSTDPSSRQLNFTWDFGDGTTGTGSNPIHVYTKAGNYVVNVNVNDGLTLNANAATTATVTGPAAEAITANIGGPYQNATNQTIQFDASNSSDNLGNPLTYAWDFGDGTTATGATPMHSYTTVGSYTVSLTVSSSTATATASATVPVTAAITVAVTSPTRNALFSTNTVTVTGTTSTPNLTVTVNGIAASVSGTSFTANGVSLREGVNLISATATDGNGGVGTGVVSVILDTTAPLVSITSPAAGATVSASSIAVAGLVSDSVTGTIGSNDVTVTVNGQPAQVSNRSYLLSSLLLAPGLNTITVVATDNVGNTSQTSETIQLLPPTSQLSIVKLSGDAQTGGVKSVLPQPLVVQLLAATGTPVSGRPITFTVTRSDGMVEVLPSTAQALSVTTDANGKASVLFQLGSRSGLGINQVSATTPGAAASALFTASSTVSTPAQIHIVNGDNQRGLLGQSLAQGFQVIVEDSYGNPTPGVTVNFTPTGASDGTLDNPAPVTDQNGKAIASLTLGQQEGLGNYVVNADFAGDTGSPVAFISSAYAPGPVANTSVSGTVLDNTQTPVQNATVTLAGTGLSTVTNVNGNFTINGAPVGTVTLTVDGSTATTTNTLPFLSFVLQDLPGINNTVGKPIYLPIIDINDAQTVGSSEAVTLTMAGVPGLAFTVAPNSVTFPDGSTVGKLSLSQVKSDLVPMEPSNGTNPNVVWTIQPAGTKFSVPIQMTVPNTQGMAPGAVTEIFQYDHDLEQFVSIGTGHVSADGSVITSDPGFGITKAGWSHCCTPPVNNGCVTSCNSTNPCIQAKLSPSGCLCYKIPRTGATCGKPNTSTSGVTNSCLLQGTCDAYGVCSGTKVFAGIPCSPKPDFCDIAGECSGTGQCVSTGKIPDTVEHQYDDGGPDSISAAQSLDSLAKPINEFLLEIGIPVQITGNVTNQASNTYTCCSASQRTDQLILDDSVSATLGLNSIEVPLRLPNGLPMGISLSNGTVFGAFGQVGGALTGSLTVHSDTCANKQCSKFGFGPSATLTMGVHLPNDYASIGIEVTGGFQATATAGCGEFTVVVSTQPITVTGKASYLGTSVSASAILVPSVNLLGPKTFTF